MFFPLLRELKMDYWTAHCGVDGYMFLVFQRNFLRLTIYMCVISASAQYLMYLNDKNYAFHFLGSSEEQEKEELFKSEDNPISNIEKIDTKDLLKIDKNVDKLEQKIKSNIETLHNLMYADTEKNLKAHRAWVVIGVIFMFTMLTLFLIQKTRKESKKALECYA